jgi:hypothetical protein
MFWVSYLSSYLPSVLSPYHVNQVQERAGNTLEVIGIGKDFLNRTTIVQQLRESMDKWDFIKLKSYCTKKKWSLN